MNYLDVQETLTLLNKELPQAPILYGMTQLADLCRREHLTPLFYYSKYLDHLDPEHDYPIIKPSAFSGYLSADSLQSLVNKPTSPPIPLLYATIYETYKADNTALTKGDKVALCSTAHDGNPQNTMTTYDLKEHDAATVTHDDLVFPIEQVQDYIELVKCEELKRQLAQAQARNNEQLDDNTAKDYLTTIGLLLELLQRKPKGFSKDGTDLPALFPSQAKIIEAIDEQEITKQRYKKLEKRFSLANEALADKHKQ